MCIAMDQVVHWFLNYLSYTYSLEIILCKPLVDPLATTVVCNFSNCPDLTYYIDCINV